MVCGHFSAVLGVIMFRESAVKFTFRQLFVTFGLNKPVIFTCQNRKGSKIKQEISLRMML